MVISRVQGPDGAWADQISPFLAHKGEPWNWQIRRTLAEDVAPLHACYYLGVADGEVIGNACIFSHNGVGILGHVFTAAQHRRVGVCWAVMTALMADFRASGGLALILGTDYDSAPWHIYRRLGFEPTQPGSGQMEWYADGIDRFESDWFAEAPSRVRPVDWRDWPGLTALTTQRAGGGLRFVSLGVHGRTSMEYAFLPMYRRLTEGSGVSAAALESEGTGATVGAALIVPDNRFPGVSILDLFVHPRFEGKGGELLRALPMEGGGGKLQACAETGDAAKIGTLEDAGFVREAELRGQLTLDGRPLDVAILSRQTTTRGDSRAPARSRPRH
jgi:GNAT superfamily N-acetyltransferase